MIIKYHIVYFLLKGDIVTHRMDKNLEKSLWDVEMLSKKYPLFLSSYDYLLSKHNKFELSVSETLQEIQMSPSDFYAKKKEGVGIPSYRQKDEKARISFPLVCVALFLCKDFRLVN